MEKIVTDNALSFLTPTIRAADSEIWISLNPDASAIQCVFHAMVNSVSTGS